jgi:hypothetical protein
LTTPMVSNTDAAAIAIQFMLRFSGGGFLQSAGQGFEP